MGQTSTRKVKTGGSLTWKQREQMILEFLSGQYSKAELWKKYTGQSQEHGQLVTWMRKLGYLAGEKQSDVSDYLHSRTHKKLLMKQDLLHNDDSKAKLLSKIKELEKLLELEKIRSQGYEMMIDMAEKELNIPIRKKLNTK